MSEPSSLYVRVHLQTVKTYGDPITQSTIDEIAARSQSARTVEDGIAAWSRHFAKSVYDEARACWQFGILEFSENYHEFVTHLPFVRAACRFKDRPGDDFLLVYPFLWSPEHHDVAFTLDAGTSERKKRVPTKWKAEANAFLDAAFPIEAPPN